MEDSFFILAGWLLDGTGAAARSNMLLEVRGREIASLKKARREDLEALGSRVSDYSNCLILPGLVDCHVHLCMSGTVDDDVRKHQLGYDFEEARPVIARTLNKHLAYGVVAVRDGGDSAGHVLRYKREDAVFPDDWRVALSSAGKAWRSKGRYGRLIGRPPREGLSLAEGIAAQQSKPDHTKVINSGLNSLKVFGKETLPQFSLEELEAGVRVGLRMKLKTMAHANGREPVRISIEAGCHSIEHGYFMGRDNIRRLAERQVFWVPTAFAMKAYARELPPDSLEAQMSERNLESQLGQIALAREAGVVVVVGTDSGGLGLHHGEAFSEELKLLMQAGYPLEEAVRCASTDGARLIGVEDRVGAIQRGAPATFVVVRGTPEDLPEALGSPGNISICLNGRWTTPENIAPSGS
ncbi:MAG: amidohydrolase family protein [Syntrophobacteraceae bacterium]